MSVEIVLRLNGAELPVTLNDAAVLAISVAVAELAQTPEPTSPYMTILEAAEYLCCSRQRIDDLLSQRRLTRVKDGSRTLVQRREIEAHLAIAERPA
jgi:excisionase family DNA binding protein